ncbi:hypothetical protein Patl1_29710 [Pistacia atlantica]|uniref:Uncharacterized protein n=1 Tax=Pistacia atlantica TaxID=434234 RepID=A0ACC1AEL4_9ROSI|nr:hypothetical protein Patl1_29710 [Pistacia atlantica]
MVVKIFNEIGKGIPLTVKCKLGDKDLEKKLVYYKEYYKFSFNPRPKGTALYFCNFAWQNEFHLFDVWVNDRDLV